EAWYFSADGNHSTPVLFWKRTPDVVCSVNHYEGDEFVIHTNMNKAMNYKLMLAKISESNSAKWKTLVEHRENVLLGGYTFTIDFLMLKEKENAQDRLRYC